MSYLISENNTYADSITNVFQTVISSIDRLESFRKLLIQSQSPHFLADKSGKAILCEQGFYRVKLATASETR